MCLINQSAYLPLTCFPHALRPITTGKPVGLRDGERTNYSLRQAQFQRIPCWEREEDISKYNSKVSSAYGSAVYNIGLTRDIEAGWSLSQSWAIKSRGAQIPEMDMVSFNHTASSPVCPDTGYRRLCGKLVNDSSDLTGDPSG